MSDFGFQCFTPSGNVQIDGQNPCHNMVQSVYGVTGQGQYSATTRIAIPESGLLFHNCTVPLRFGDYWNGTRLVTTQSAAGFSAFRFTDDPIYETGGYGIEVFNGSGRLIFSSAYKPLKIVGVYTIYGNNPDVNNISQFAVPPNCVVALSTPTEFMRKLPGYQAEIFGGATSVNGGIVTYRWIKLDQFDTWDDIRNRDIPYYYGYDSGRAVNIIVAQLDYL